MNEQSERAIYEWLGYKDSQCFKCGGWMYRYDEQFWKSCPPLDMNTWDREALPKLDRDEVTASFYGGLWHLDANMFANADPWLALLDYIKAVRQ